MSLERRPWPEQEAFQIQQLQLLKQYLLQHSRYYKASWSKLQLLDRPINTIADLQQYPCTTKEDIQQHENDFLCIPQQAVREYNTTSGTLGAPISVALSENDIVRLSYNEALSFDKLQIEPGERVQLMLTLDRMFMAGMAYYGGLKQRGAAILRTGAGMPQLQWDAILKYQPTTLVAVPSFLLKMIQYAEQHGIDYKKSSVKKVLAIGESLKNEYLQTNELYKKINSHWDVALYSSYASTEMQTAFTECEMQQGGHLHAELLVVETVDEYGQQVPEGTVGEVCVTTLGVEGMPLWRYRTGDLAILYTKPCACGRPAPRLSGIAGRKNQMLKVKGTTIYPAAIFDALHQFLDCNNYVVEVTSNALGQDEVRLYLLLPEADQNGFKTSLSEYLRGKLKIVPEMVFITAEALKAMQFPEMSRKQIKFVDKRQQFV